MNVEEKRLPPKSLNLKKSIKKILEEDAELIRTKEQLNEVLRSLIYHGRHFSPTRDKVVLRKSSDAIFKLFKKGGTV